ncbi:MAG: hypothetical protein MUE56_04890 [Ignavibacteria bacterium]|jgi:hypothetical protein|nr:hypothetical protein [Ignavibacteria bacterium]
MLLLKTLNTEKLNNTEMNMFNPYIKQRTIMEIRDLFYYGNDISDEEILMKRIIELNRSAASHIPDVLIFEILAARLLSCVSERINGFTRDFLKERKDKTVREIIDYLDFAEHAIKSSGKYRINLSN